MATDPHRRTQTLGLRPIDAGFEGGKEKNLKAESK